MPQALLITGIVVAFSATALAVALLLRLCDETGSVTLVETRQPRPGTTPVALRPHDGSARTMLTTAGGWLLLLAVLAPFVGVLAGLVLGGRNAQRVAMLLMPVGLAVAAGIAWSLVQSGDTVVYLLGGWAPPLGIALRADGLSVVMLLAVAVVVCGIGVYARADFGSAAGEPEQRAPFVFWLLLLAVWGSLNLVFVSGDLFTLYVALELLTFSGVPLVCLDGSGETLRAALRYLLFALAGSLLYLLGAVLLYGGYGTLDIALLAGAAGPSRSPGPPPR